MKGTVVATAALVVLAVGGTPAATQVLNNDTPSPSDATQATSQGSDRTHSPQPGPPAWADGEGRAKQGDKHAGQLKGWAKNDTGRAAKLDKPEKTAKAEKNGKTGKPAKASKAGKAGNGHGLAVRAWAHCVSDFNRAQDQDAGGGKAAASVCGQKPLSPGQVKAEKKKPAQRPGGAESAPRGR